MQYAIEKEKKTDWNRMCFLVKAAASGKKTGATKCVSKSKSTSICQYLHVNSHALATTFKTKKVVLSMLTSLYIVRKLYDFNKNIIANFFKFPKKES